MNMHMRHLRSVFNRLIGAGLKLKLAKCHLFCNEVGTWDTFCLGTVFNLTLKKLSCARDYQVPTDVRQLGSFIDFAGYYRRFILGFSQVSAPLFNLLEKGRQLTGVTTVRQCSRN